MTTFAGWENFYVIVGSSAGALIGLQFVVLTLVANRPIMRGDARQAGDAFATPSVVHFAVVLLLSAIVSAPWDGIDIVSGLWGLVGLSGVVYTLIVVRRLRVQTLYRPVFEDWVFHAVLPFGAYVMLAVSVCVIRLDERSGMALVGGAALLLLFIGIHNAWDAVAYHVFVNPQDASPQPGRDKTSEHQKP
jgi:hypothetical protein